MGCVYSNNKICQSEVINDVENIKEIDKLPQIKINDSNHFINETIKIDMTTFPKEKIKSQLLNSGSIVMSSNRSSQKIKEGIIFETQEGLLTKESYFKNGPCDSPDLFSCKGSSGSFQKKKSIKNHMIKQRNAKIFGDVILTQFNLARTNPLVFAEKLENLIKFIKPNVKEIKSKYKEAYKFVLQYSDKKMIGLPSGEEGFKKAIDFLRNCKPIGELQWNDEIYLDFDIDNLDKLDIQIKEKVFILKQQFPLFNMHMDVVKDSELSAILQIVDDTRYNGRRRETIMNPKFNSMSLSQAKNKNKQLLTLLSFC